MTSDLQQTRYDQLIRRVGGIIGPGSKVAEALSELFPVIDVERVPGELLLLGGTQICSGAALRAGDVAESGRIQIFNPVGSSKLIAVSSVLFSTTTSQVIRWTTNKTALTDGIGTERFRDERLATTSRPAGQIRSDSTVALTDATGQARITSNTIFRLEDENGIAVLPPGSGFEMGTGTDNTTLIVTFYWRERVAIESELNLP